MRSFIDDRLTVRAKRMLAAMSLLMEGDTAGSGEPSGSNPPGSCIPFAGESLFLRYEQMLEACFPYELRKVRMILLKGEEELLDAQVGVSRVRRMETRDQKADRIVSLYEGWSSAEVAVAEQCSEALVRKFRKEADNG